jgi:hypothetical protein
MRPVLLALGLAALAAGCGGGAAGRGDAGVVYDDDEVDPTAACLPAGGAAPVAAPVFVGNIPAGETAWFSSPAVVDLDGDGRKEIVAPLYSTFVFGPDGAELAKGTATADRVYAPAVVADLDADGVMEVGGGGNDGTVAASTPPSRSPRRAGTSAPP